jgi:hypothetical protein
VLREECTILDCIIINKNGRGHPRENSPGHVGGSSRRFQSAVPVGGSSRRFQSLAQRRLAGCGPSSVMVGLIRAPGRTISACRSY